MEAKIHDGIYVIETMSDLDAAAADAGVSVNQLTGPFIVVGGNITLADIAQRISPDFMNNMSQCKVYNTAAAKQFGIPNGKRDPQIPSYTQEKAEQVSVSVDQLIGQIPPVTDIEQMIGSNNMRTLVSLGIYVHNRGATAALLKVKTKLADLQRAIGLLKGGQHIIVQDMSDAAFDFVWGFEFKNWKPPVSTIIINPENLIKSNGYVSREMTNKLTSKILKMGHKIYNADAMSWQLLLIAAALYG